VAREALQKEISKQTGQNLGGKIMKDGSVTFEWFVRNRYYPLRDWRPETEKVKKVQIERDLVEKFDSVTLEAFEQFTLQKHLKHLATFLSEDRVKHARSYMKSIFAEAVEQDFLLKDPTRGIKIPRNLLRCSADALLSGQHSNQPRRQRRRGMLASGGTRTDSESAILIAP
jgi:hypothetical protein